ncbi:MAG: hypothetical protein ICV59_00845 [Thermoleophilia bacterium]|nr:hypothetical protein [Thermoleophilia bacterium]
MQVASYRLGSGSTADLAQRIEEGNIPVIRALPGFAGYCAFEAADRVVASVLVFESRAGVEEAERRLAGWIEATVEEFDVTPLDVLEGDVFASST